MQKAKTRAEIANEYGIHRNTFRTWLKTAGIKLSNRLITPKEQALIYSYFGYPSKQKVT